MLHTSVNTHLCLLVDERFAHIMLTSLLFIRFESGQEKVVVDGGSGGCGGFSEPEGVVLTYMRVR